MHVFKILNFVIIVVASEVGKLADESRTLAQNIRSIIEEVTSETEEAVAAMMYGDKGPDGNGYKNPEIINGILELVKE